MPWKRYKLNLVKEKDAKGRTREIFDEIKEALGVPYVSTLFQVLASFPEFFDLFWRSAKDVVSTQEFFLFSERLGAEAYTRVHNYFSVPSLRSPETKRKLDTGILAELHQMVELYQYSSSMLLLVSAALIQEFENPGRETQRSMSIGSHPKFSGIPLIVEEHLAPATSRKIFADIKRTLNVPFLNICYLNLGQWPDFLKLYWESLKPLMRTPIYEQQRLSMRDSALSLAAELPRPLHVSTAHLEEAGVQLDDIYRVIQLSELFLDLLSRQVLNMAFAKIGLEDGFIEQVAA
jgi:Halocarboxylic acid dehydrogenase DehI